MTDKIAPCPFCGGDSNCEIDDGGNGIAFRGWCKDCYARGPRERCAADALSSWNHRTRPPAAPSGHPEAVKPAQEAAEFYASVFADALQAKFGRP